MSLKVGTSPVAGTAVARSGPVHGGAAPAAMFQSIAGLSSSPNVGPEEQSLMFQGSWDNLPQQGQKKSPARTLNFEGVRFGDILTTSEVSSTLVNYQATHDIITLPTVRFGAMVYEMSMRAINNNGATRSLGSSVNRLS